ncbi:MAG: FkbM family methyltransferase [Pleurocapsa sp. MO_226.B13]|nr:FkbM family methyltransferase [Pleurocapsa sp. MO_226.B13]
MTQISKILRKVTQALHKQHIDSYIIKKQIEDLSFDFLIGDAEGKEWYDSTPEKTKESLNPEFRFIQRLIKPGDIVFECGTHHGLTAILLSEWVGKTGKVISFEINEKNTQIARKNLELNQIDNVIIEQKGLGSNESKLKIFDKSNSSIAPSNIISLAWLKNFIYGISEAEIISLDYYSQTQSIKPTFLKIDVEGYESEVLKGAREILKTLPKLEIEIHTEILSRYDTSVREIFELIEIDKYQTWVQWDDRSEPKPFDLQQKIDRRVHLFALPKDRGN